MPRSSIKVLLVSVSGEPSLNVATITSPLLLAGQPGQLNARDIAMETTFHFVNGSKVDRNARRLLKSHVMKGKNAGKKIHRQSRLNAVSHNPSRWEALQLTHHASHEARLLAYSRSTWPATNSRALGNVLLTASYPAQLTPYSTQVVNQCA